MILRFSDYTLDIDVDRTRAFYDSPAVLATSEQCSCPGCRNYDKAILTAPAEVLDFLRSLGIDPRKPAEVFDVMGMLDENGGVYYAGWYHICGTIIHEESRLDPLPEAEGQAPGSQAHWNNGHTHKPLPEFPFEVSFEEECFVLHEKFPAPTLQMEIDTHLPWVLSTPYNT